MLNNYKNTSLENNSLLNSNIKSENIVSFQNNVIKEKEGSF
jgi:hypothetical protein